MREVLGSVRDAYRQRMGTVPEWVEAVLEELS